MPRKPSHWSRILAVAFIGPAGVAMANWPFASRQALTVKQTKVTVDRLMYPRSAAHTHIAVDLEYHPGTLWQLLRGPQEEGRSVGVQLLHDPGITPQNTPMIRAGFGVAHSPLTFVPDSSGKLYRCVYDIPWVGRGILMDFIRANGKTYRIEVPFDERQNVPRPADLTHGDW